MSFLSSSMTTGTLDVSKLVKETDSTSTYKLYARHTPHRQFSAAVLHHTVDSGDMQTDEEGILRTAIILAED